jgi:SSS family solute:Na+ symporter
VNFNTFDLVICIGFYAAVLGFAFWKSRGSSGATDYFLGGRSLPWWLIGVSIVAANISTEQMVGMAGQGAGGVGLAVSLWQLTGSIGIVLIAFTLLPRLLRSGITTIPEYLEYRYNGAARAIMAVFTVVIYVSVLLTAVLYSGGLTLEAVFGISLRHGVWALGAVAALYTVWGGLKAVAWADLFQGLALIAGGLLLFGLGLNAVGGWSAFAAANADRLHVILPADHPGLPWTGVVSGMWIVIVYYCGLNQFIVQRTLAARSLRDGQMGVILAGALWLIVPFAIVLPGGMAAQLFPEVANNPDSAFPRMVTGLVPAGLRGFMLAAIAGAIVSSLGSILNSASTVFTMDVYQRLIRPQASQRNLLLVGRIVTALCVAISCTLAPALADPRFGGVFQFIQQFQGYIWPGVVAAFAVGLLVPQAPPSAGVAALVVGPAVYGLFQAFAPSVHFLIQVALTFQLVLVVMGVITFLWPLREARMLPERLDVETKTAPSVYVAGVAVIAATFAFVVAFW